MSYIIYFLHYTADISNDLTFCKIRAISSVELTKNLVASPPLPLPVPTHPSYLNILSFWGVLCHKLHLRYPDNVTFSLQVGASKRLLKLKFSRLPTTVAIFVGRDSLRSR